MNAYSIDLRTRVIAYLDEGHTHRETSKLFKISTRTICNWSKLLRAKEDLMAKHTPRSPHKLPDNELLEYVKAHPDLFLREIANHFKCGLMTVHDALKHNSITYKKTKIIRGKGRREAKKIYRFRKNDA